MSAFFYGINMALIKELNGVSPKMGENCFLAENATLIGQLEMGNDCSIWYNAVVRADVNTIKFGNKVNIQDGAMVHCTYQKCGTTLGNNVSVGHNAIIHGCEIHDNVLIGMGAIVMDECVVEEGCIIAAGSVLTQGTKVKAGSLYAGVPAKFIKEISPELRNGEIERIANNYVKYAGWYK